jgi:hypothetical protein
MLRPISLGACMLLETGNSKLPGKHTDISSFINY